MLRSFAFILLLPLSVFAEFPITLTYPVDKGVESFSGRVFVIVSKKEIGGQVHSQSWFTPEPFYAKDVKNWRSGTPLAFTPQVSFPADGKALKSGAYFVQAIMDRDMGGQNPLTSAGNLFSKGLKVDWPKSDIVLSLDQVVPEKKFAEKPRVKLFEMESPLLTKFHGKPMKLRAGVVLPKSFAEMPERKFPVVYEIPGFGGNHHFAHAAEGRNATDVDGIEMLYVVLDPSCRLGHHVFADSANNGPVGRALIEEFIPALEKQFRGLGKPGTRFVTGHSSGGWSSLWLQTTYPDFFGGCWSTAPDSVDFRDFQLVDLYAPKANLFTDAKGEARPLARRDGKTVLMTKQFSDMERVFGRGGQLGSFEAVFSPRSPDGGPKLLWNRDTGAVDPETATSWQPYDIRWNVEKDWPTQGPKLAGKIHVIMGAEDTFFLDGATRLLKLSHDKLMSDAVIEIVPGRHHGNLIDAAMRQRIHREMAAAFRKGQ